MTRQEIYKDVVENGKQVTKQDLIDGLTELNDSYHNVVMKGESLVVDGKWYESADDQEEFYPDLDYVMYAGGLWVEE